MILDWVREVPRSRRDEARDALARRSSRPEFVLAIVAALFAVAVGLLTATPALATSPGSTYDTAVYAYDAPALSSSPDTAASYVRGSPSGPGVGLWVSPAFVRGDVVAANTVTLPVAATEVDVEVEVSGHIHWMEILVARDLPGDLLPADDGVLLQGVVEDVDQDGVLTLRIADAVVLVETTGEPPLGVVGEHVAMLARDPEIYPTGA